MLKKETFGTTQKGETITLYTFENQQGMKMTVSEFRGCFDTLVCTKSSRGIG